MGTASTYQSSGIESMVNRVAAEGLQVRQYFHRYTEDALDLCDYCRFQGTLRAHNRAKFVGPDCSRRGVVTIGASEELMPRR